MDYAETKFFGAGYDPAQDHERLSGQLQRVFDFMTKRPRGFFEWRTLRQISETTGSPEASVSASLRTLRNQHHFVIERRRITEGKGTFAYRFGGPLPEEERITARIKKMKPVGDPELWGEMMRLVYANAHAKSEGEALKVLEEAQDAFVDWMADMGHRIRRDDA